MHELQGEYVISKGFNTTEKLDAWIEVNNFKNEFGNSYILLWDIISEEETINESK